jgi:hypothetical protein
VVAGLEKQHPPDQRRPGADVDRVRRAIEEVVFLGVVRIEDVVGDDPDLADQRAGGLELGDGGQRPGR